MAALEGRWRELDFEAAWVEARERRLAHGMVGAVSRYLADRAADGSILLGGETAFEFPVGRALATGTIDRVERDASGRIRVIDLKTGSTRPSAAQTRTHAQLGVYQLAVRAGAVEGVDGAEWDVASVKQALEGALIDALGLKPRVAFGPVRVATSGRRVSPPLFESLAILGREETLARIRTLRRTLATSA